MANSLRNKPKKQDYKKSEKILFKDFYIPKVDNIKYFNNKVIKNIPDKNIEYNKIDIEYNEKSNNSNSHYIFVKHERAHIIYYLIFLIIFLCFCCVNSEINSARNRNGKNIKFYSYEITLKVKGTGLKNILGTSYPNIYPNPSKIYLNNEVVENIIGLNQINIIETDSEIKIEWDNIPTNSIKGMFYNCTEILEIDMTKFDTSLITDMSELFSSCYSLKSLNVSNLITTNVQTMENMFYKCINLRTLNLESFRISSVISLKRMFYGCINLEYINIKNFEEKQNMNIDEMFFDIAPNAVICLASCPPPTNFTISSINGNEVTLSWIGYDFNKFMMSYGSTSLSNPDQGTTYYVENTENYKFTNIGGSFNEYIKTVCGSKSSYWIGPLSVITQIYNMENISSKSISTCSLSISWNKCYNNGYSILTINPDIEGKILTIKGQINEITSGSWLSIYDGIEDNENFLKFFVSADNIPLYVSTTGLFTLKFNSPFPSTCLNLQLTAGCMHISKTIYNSIYNKNCYKISCDGEWKKIQNLVESDTGKCVNNCFSSKNRYLYRGKCYPICPNGTSNVNYTCYSNEILEKCEEYSNESDYENLCIKCKKNFYQIFNGKNNTNHFINCYKNNSLEKYYLDNNDLYFKLCYKTCKTCIQNGTKENHNCISCDINYEFNLTFGKYYNCYPKCNNYYYLDEEKNFICLNKKECPTNYSKLIKEKNQCIYDCEEDPDYPFEFQNECYNLCPANVSEKSKDKKFCEIKCPKESPYVLIENQICVNNCSISQLNNKLCKLQFKSENKSEINEIQEKMVEDIRKEIVKDLDISEIKNGKNIIIYERDIKVLLSKIDYQKNQISEETNNTSIDLKECETKLKYIYNISENESLYILKMEVKQNGYQIPKMQYEVYYPLYNDSKLNFLNLSFCNGIKIDIYLPFIYNGSIDQINPRSNFYNDICNTYTSENGTDLTLSERKNNYINKNLVACEENCDFVNYNKSIEKVKCSCEIKTNFISQISENIFNKEKLYKSFTDFNNIFNIKALKCIKLIFSASAFKENYANIILLIIISIYFVCLIIFISKSYYKEIKYYLEAIIFFTLFPAKVSYIIKTKKNEKQKTSHIFKTNNNINNISNSKNKILSKNALNFKNRGKNKLKKFNNKNATNLRKKPLFKMNFKQSKKSNPNKKKEQSNIRKVRKPDNKAKEENDLIKKIKLEEKMNRKYKKYNYIFNKFKNSTEIYELHKKIYKKTDNELNNLSYKDALKYDKRTYFKYYFSLIRSKHLFFFSFYPKFDFNSRILKLYLFFFKFATYFFVNALFFNDETMGKINIDRGSFNFIYNLPQIIYSTIISTIINSIVDMFSLTENSFIEYKNKVKRATILLLTKKLISSLKIKFAIFFVLNFVLLGLYWIYLSCFCAIYQNTQIYLIKDTIISFSTSFIAPIIIYLFPGIFRIFALKNNKRSILYKINKILQIL